MGDGILMNLAGVPPSCPPACPPSRPPRTSHAPARRQASARRGRCGGCGMPAAPGTPSSASSPTQMRKQRTRLEPRRCRRSGRLGNRKAQGSGDDRPGGSLDLVSTQTLDFVGGTDVVGLSRVEPSGLLVCDSCVMSRFYAQCMVGFALQNASCDHALMTCIYCCCLVTAICRVKAAILLFDLPNIRLYIYI